MHAAVPVCAQQADASLPLVPVAIFFVSDRRMLSFFFLLFHATTDNGSLF
jgi:hypothetical protein